MIRDAMHSGRNQDIWLFYSNRDPAAAAYLSELQAADAAHEHFNLVATMTSVEDGSTTWDSETGFVDHEMLKRHLPDVAAPIYYCVGPPAMVSATQEMLEKAGVDHSDLIIEKFTGY